MLQQGVYRFKLKALLIAVGLSLYSSSLVEFNVKIHREKAPNSVLHFSTNATSHSILIQQIDQQSGFHNQWRIFETKGLHIYKTTILGELDRLEPAIYTVCFLSSLKRSLFVPFNVMHNLVQTDSNIHHSADMQLEEELIVQEHQILPGNLSRFGQDVVSTCLDASVVYASGRDLRLIARGNNTVEESLLDATLELRTRDDANYPYCKDASPHWAFGCICHRTMCLDWFPCKTQFCTSIDELGSDVSHVCGIRTCGQCQTFEFFVEKKSNCFWDVS